MQLLCSIQYRVVRQNADDAFYELQNPKEQIQAYVFDGTFHIIVRPSTFILLCAFSFPFASQPLSIICVLFLFIVVRAHVPRMTLDELFEQKGEVAKAVSEELEKVTRLLQHRIYLFSVICFLV